MNKENPSKEQDSTIDKIESNEQPSSLNAATSSNKKAIYSQPQLTSYGSIRSVTQNGRSRAGFDFFGGRRNIV